MNLTELTRLYVIELKNSSTINSERTIKSYIAAMIKFYNENSRIYRMTKEDIKLYMSNIRNKYSDSYYNVIGSSIKILYEKVLKQPNKMNWFKPLKIKRQFVNIISFNDFVMMMKNTDQIKHKLIIILFYSTGIRLSELLDIELSDIDYLNSRIFINTLKGGKNRYVPLHELTIKYLKSYLKKWHPIKYLFEGQNGDKYTSSSVQSMIKKVSNNKYSPHKFRHAFISNIIENEDVFATMELAGHSSLKSTLFYNHISPYRLNKMYNPLDMAI